MPKNAMAEDRERLNAFILGKPSRGSIMEFSKKIRCVGRCRP